MPRREVIVDIPEKQKACPDCGHDRQPIGFDEMKRLEFTPASFYQEVRLLKKYACRDCQGQVVAAPSSDVMGPIERGLPGPGLVAHVITSKFCDHLPLYRQGVIYRRHGVDVPRSTMGDWVRQTADLKMSITKERLP